jgi:hypothetical protein
MGRGSPLPPFKKGENLEDDLGLLQKGGEFGGWLGSASKEGREFR